MSFLSTLPASGPASSLAAIEARLKEIEGGQRDFSALPVVLHQASGLRFRVGPMKRADHEAWHALRFIENVQHQESGAEEKNAPQTRPQSDRFLLEHAVFDDGGTLLPNGVVTLLMDGAGFGPSTYALLDSAAAQNPPRAMLVNELAKIWGATTTNLIFMRVLKEAGLFKLLLDRLAGDETERAFAESELSKVEETLLFWEAAFEADQQAKDYDLETYEKAGLVPSLEGVGD